MVWLSGLYSYTRYLDPGEVSVIMTSTVSIVSSQMSKDNKSCAAWQRFRFIYKILVIVGLRILNFVLML